MSAVVVAWLLLAWLVILLAALDLVASLRGPESGRSWCLDCRDGRECDCAVAKS